MPETYRVTTEDGTYHVTVGDEPIAQPTTNTMLGMMHRNPNVEPDTTSFMARLRSVSERSRFPTSLSDLAPLLIPDAAAALSGLKPYVLKAISAAKEGGIMTAPKRMIQTATTQWTDPLTLGERSARDAPLYQQMEHIPTTAPSSAESVAVRPAAGKMSEVRGNAYDVPGPTRSQMPPLQLSSLRPALSFRQTELVKNLVGRGVSEPEAIQAILKLQP